MHLLKRLYFYLSWPGLALYFARGSRSRVAVIDGDGRLLLVQGRKKSWYDDDEWGLPGGGLHGSESPASGAAREIAEELGIHAADTDFELLAQERIVEHGIGSEVHLFKLVVDASVPLSLQPNEIVAAKWCNSQELLTLSLKSDVRRALELLVAKG